VLEYITICYVQVRSSVVRWTQVKQLQQFAAYRPPLRVAVRRLPFDEKWHPKGVEELK